MDKTKVYIVGGGIAGLAAAVFAIRDGHIPEENIYIFEVMNVLGGALDGTGTTEKYVCRGARKYNYPAFNCTWNLLHTIPSLTDSEKSVMDGIVEYNELNKKDVQTVSAEDEVTGCLDYCG